MKQILITLALIAAAAIPAGAKDKYVDPYKGYDEAVFMDMDLDSNLETPVVGNGEKAAVKRYMNRLAKDFAAKKYIVDMLRDDEVMLITIPTDELFLPNDTLLSPYASARLNPLLGLMKDPEMFKIVYGVHTDNTGTPKYNMDLAHRRNSSIYDWLLDNISEDQIVIPYEFGDTDPIEPNTTRKGRAQNRRIEIYVIPGPKLIETAHKNLIR